MKVSHRLPVCVKGGGGVIGLCCGPTDKQTDTATVLFISPFTLREATLPPLPPGATVWTHRGESGSCSDAL